jgi:aryl-alcohol dehydrogenase-like predicted oxidoreductase
MENGRASLAGPAGQVVQVPIDIRVKKYQVSLGCGLIGIGRPWGYAPTEVPTEAEALRFLEHAFKLGIRYFDTAPSYALSEARLGSFLRRLTPEQREEVVVATKFGERWDESARDVRVDHSLDVLTRSLDQSLKLLGAIDVLQIHKTTPEVLRSDAIPKACAYAAGAGIQEFGASIKDMESARIVCCNRLYSVIQLPYNADNAEFAPAIDMAAEQEKLVLVNRPLNMGRLAASAGPDQFQGLVAAFKFVLARRYDGVVLTGTKSVQHLDENWRAFKEAVLQSRV